MLNKKKNNKGFTLVELLVVIAIIGILAVVAVPALFKNIEKGKIADLESDISAIKSAALSVYADTSSYPDGDVTDTSSIGKELEGLSKPFGGTYTLRTKYISSTGDYSNSESTNSLTPDKGKVLQLVIGSGMKKISASGVDKLKQDLGDKLTNTSFGSQPSGEVTEIVVNLIVNMY